MTAPLTVATGSTARRRPCNAISPASRNDAPPPLTPTTAIPTHVGGVRRASDGLSPSHPPMDAAFFGALLLGVVSEAVLAPLIVMLLLQSAFKVWRHA